MRRMVWGCWRKVTGSKAPPAFPAPYACIPSMVLLLLSLPPRCWLKGTGCVEHRVTETENPRNCSLSPPLYYRWICWDARLPPPPVSFGDLFSRAVGFKCTSNISPLCVGKESFVMVLDSDASPFSSAQKPVATPWTRLRCHASDGALLVKTPE